MTPSKDQDLLSAAADRPTCIQLRNFQVFRGGHPVTSTIDWDIDPGTFWAIVGKSGTGKTSLAQSLSGRYYYKGSRWIQPDLPIAFVEQQHHFRNRSNTSDFYYQQRFQSQDAEDALSIRELLEKNDSADTIKLLETFHLITSIDKPLIQLSNGENKRLQMVQALLGRPNLLILDNPFTGLDLDGRSLLHGLLKDLHQGGMTILLITTSWEIPESCTHVLELGSNEVIYKGSRSDYRPAPITETHSIPEELLQGLPRLKETEFESAIRIRNGRVQYGENIILENLNWEVRKGDCWVISGPNGAGKSTLLSLITGDHPQAYANALELFDRRRGSGESIWDIKRKIGLVSPELHLFFPAGTNVYHTVGSGLFDTMGLFRPLNTEQEEWVALWMRIFHLEDIRLQPLSQLSLGQQRKALLARALVKNPPLLVLDEPCQGLDAEQTAEFNGLIDQLVGHFGQTLLYVSHYSRQIPSCIRHRLDLGAHD